MRVSKLPPIQPSRYGRENRKFWSQIALAAMGEFFWPFFVNGTSEETIGVMMGIFGPIGNFFPLTVCRLEQY